MVEVVAPLYKESRRLEFISISSNMDLYWLNSTQLAHVEFQHHSSFDQLTSNTFFEQMKVNFRTKKHGFCLAWAQLGFQ